MTQDDLLHSDETLDELRPGKLKIIQKSRGYRFSLDPILLCAFSRINAGDTVVDLGTGGGVIPLLLAVGSGASHVYGVEVQAELADRARRSVLWNGLEKKISILAADLRQLPAEMKPGCCDAVLSNPPYRRPGTGRLAALAERAGARHELYGGLEDFLQAAGLLLRPGGRFYIVYLAERLPRLLALMQRLKLEPKRLRCVHPRPDEGARMVLVEGRKGGREGLALEPPLFIYEGKNYTKEVLGIYDMDAGEEESGRR